MGKVAQRNSHLTSRKDSFFPSSKPRLVNSNFERICRIQDQDHRIASHRINYNQEILMKRGLVFLFHYQLAVCFDQH